MGRKESKQTKTSWCPGKGTSWHVLTSNILISLRIRAVWSDSLMDALLVAKGPTYLQVEN